MDNRELLVAIFLIAAGTFSIAASVFNWEFFFNSRKATLFMNLFWEKWYSDILHSFGAIFDSLGSEHVYENDLVTVSSQSYS